MQVVAATGLAINPGEVGIQLILIVNYDSGQNTIIL